MKMENHESAAYHMNDVKKCCARRKMNTKKSFAHQFGFILFNCQAKNGVIYQNKMNVNFSEGKNIQKCQK